MRLKLLIHSNAPWSPSGYGQQVALFAPRLAEHTDLAISAFHGLANAPLNVAGLTIYPGSGAGWGNDVVQAHAERHFGSLRGGLVLSLVDVFVLEPAVWRELNAACVGAGRPRPRAARRCSASSPRPAPCRSR